MFDEHLLSFHKANNKEKADPKFGLQVAIAIYKTVQAGYNNYYFRRNNKMKASENIADGVQDMTQFLNRINIDGKESFVNLDMTPPAIAPKFIELIVQKFMEREEIIKVSAIDPNSRKKALREKQEAEFRMNNKDLIGALQQDSGIPTENPNAYTPDSYDDLEYYYGYEFQLPEEIGFEKAIEFVHVDNDFDPVLKRQLIENIVKKGLGVMYVYIDVNGMIRYRVVRPENSIYSWSDYNDFRDRSWCGEMMKMKVTEYRALFNDDYVRLYGRDMAEMKIFEDVKKAASGCPGFTAMDWNYQFINAYWRPYDDWEVEVMCFEFKTVDNDIFTAETNKYGNLIRVEKRNTMPNNPDKQIVARQVYNIYKGYYVPKLSQIFCWGKAKNMVRPQSNLSDCYFSYHFYMPQSRNMNNLTIPERIRPAVDQMTVAYLKLQQLQAAMKPAGMAVDISGLQGIDIGLGGELSPMKIVQIYSETGTLYYKRLSDDGETLNDLPIKELPNAGAVQQIEVEINVWNFWLNYLRQTIGSNEYTEGQAVNPKLGLGVMDNQIAASNRATEFLYEGYTSIMRSVCRNTGILLWDNIMFNGQNYRGFIGEEKIDESRFDVNIEMEPDEKAKAIVDAHVQAAITAGTIDALDAFKINNIKNLKLKELYLARAQKKKQQDKMQEQKALIQENTQSQIQSAQAASQSKQQEMQIEAQTKISVKQVEAKGLSDLELQKWVQKMQELSFTENRPLPQNIQAIIDAYYESKAADEANEAATQEAMMQQMAGGEPEEEMQEQGMQPQMM